MTDSQRDVTVKPEIDFSSKEVEHGTYQMMKIVPQSGSQTVTLQTTSTVTSVFELPTKVQNLGRSKLMFDLNMPALALNYCKLHGVGYPMIDRLSLATRTGTYLCDIANFNYYTRIITLATTSKDDLMSRGYVGTLNTGASAATMNFETVDAVNPFLGADPALNWMPQAATFTGRETGEPQWVISGGGAVVNTAASARYILTLGDIAGSIFSIPQDIVANEVLQLQITWSPVNKIAWGSTGAFGVTPATVPLTLGAGTISNLQMLVAVEVNPDIIKDVMSKMQSSGIQLTIPWTTNTHATNSSASSYSMSQKIGPMYGQRLLRCIFSAFDGTTQTLNTSYNNCNYTSQTDPTTQKIDTFYTSLNSERLQQFDLKPAEYSDYAVMKPLLKGSCVSSGDIHRKNHVFIDDWTGVPLIEARKHDHMFNGLDTSSELTYSVNVSAVGTAPPATLDNYLAFTTQRTMIIRPDVILAK